MICVNMYMVGDLPRSPTLTTASVARLAPTPINFTAGDETCPSLPEPAWAQMDLYVGPSTSMCNGTAI